MKNSYYNLKQDLTQRETKIAILISQGNGYQEISDLLFITLPTISKHMCNICKKAGVQSKAEFLEKYPNLVENFKFLNWN